jgi:hypothetical protein
MLNFIIGFVVGVALSPLAKKLFSIMFKKASDKIDNLNLDK